MAEGVGALHPVPSWGRQQATLFMLTFAVLITHQVPIEKYAGSETTHIQADAANPGKFLIDPSDIVGSVEDYNAIAADKVGVISPKKPTPQPPAKGPAGKILC